MGYKRAFSPANNAKQEVIPAFYLKYIQQIAN